MRSIIRDIYIKLPRYRFYDSPYPKSYGVDPKYMVRTRVEGQLRARLTNSNRSGSILVSGYRGVGKTSMVRRVLRDLKDAHYAENEIKAATWLGRQFKVLKERLFPKRKLFNPLFIDIEVNLAQDELDVRTILRVMATELLRTLIKLDNRPSSRRYNWHRFLRFSIASAALTAIWFFAPDTLSWTWLWKPVDDPYAFTHEFRQAILNWMNLAVRIGGPIAAGIVTFKAVKSFQRVRSPYYMEHSLDHLCERLQDLIERISSSVDEERQTGITPSSTIPLSMFRRKRRAFPMASIKEIELELIDIMERFGRLDNDPFPRKRVNHARAHEFNKRYLVFVVDELDKLVPRGFKSVWDKEREDPTDDAGPGATQPGLGPKGSDLYRERQEAVATLFANLKHFLNVAQAKFIFIGGHDLYDGVQADTSDRDPFFGSIFNQVIYVPTLLKEEQSNAHGPVRGLASTVERFIAEAILTEEQLTGAEKKSELSSLRHVQDALFATGTLPNTMVLPIQQALQNLGIYLTFRSNGSTKKLVQLFERSVQELTKAQIERMASTGAFISGRPFNPDVPASSVVTSTDGDANEGLYLRLSPIDQHAHGLLTHIYRPFLSELSRYYSALNDKNLVSFTYLLDHLFKYHSTAFSFFHLQLTPEIIAVDKIPDFHKFMDDTVQRLSANSIRQVDNGLFGFQFYTKLYNEISVLTKISDLDSAALNFSLDESLPVKQHFYRRLNQAQQMSDADRKDRKLSPMAISSIHHTLGDLHFFDQQLDDALAQYRAATHLLEDDVDGCLRGAALPATRMRRDIMNQFVKIKLKEILCLEKMKIFEVALAVSTQLTQDILRYVKQWQHLGTKDIGNWRLLTLALVHRLALLDKTARKGIEAKDLAGLEMYLYLIGQANRTPMHRHIPLEGAVHEHLGTVLFYSGLGIPQPLINLPAMGSAREAYARALSIALWGRRRLAFLSSIIWADVHALPELEKPRALHVANILSKYTDTLIADRVFGPIVVPRIPMRFEFEGIDVLPLLNHSVLGDITAHILATAKAYLVADSLFQAVFQVKKLLHLLLEHANRSSSAALPVATLDDLSDWAVNAVHAYNGRVDTMQLAKAREHLQQHSASEDWRLSALVSYSPEVREIELLRNEVYLKAGLIAGAAIRDMYEGEIGEVSSTFTRMRMLMVCIRVNWSMLDPSITAQFGFGGTPTAATVSNLHIAPNVQAGMLDVVRDALHACFSLMDGAQLYGTGFVANHSVLGKIKSHLGDWCLILQRMSADHRATILQQLQVLLGDRYSTRVDPMMYYSMAIGHFRRAISMHGRGKAYRRVMNDMYLLEDDYKDNFYHFCCAMERMQVSDPGTRGHNQRIEWLKQLTGHLAARNPGRKHVHGVVGQPGTASPVRYA
ncbi:MAG: ATP-binding protein [Flavobacteriales bacterium]|nr:ATP-binding protein [Flavobacteriales bacterium]